VCAQSNIGPTFGSGHDLLVASGANSNTSSSSNLGRSYVLPAGQSATAFFTGGQHFQAAEVEVFAVVDHAAAADGAAGADEHGQAWEADFGALVGRGALADALEKERAALASAVGAHARLLEHFEREEAFIGFFDADASDIVTLNLSGEALAGHATLAHSSHALPSSTFLLTRTLPPLPR